MTDFFTSKVTIYNDISVDKVRRFERFVIDKCQITGQLVENNNSTIRKVVNADTVITKDICQEQEHREIMRLLNLSLGDSKMFCVHTSNIGSVMTCEKL